MARSILDHDSRNIYIPFLRRSGAAPQQRVGSRFYTEAALKKQA
jgi:hypothetical protein